jgi:hypothetical protein
LNRKGLVGVVKFSLVAITLVILSFFIINYVLPSAAENYTPTISTVDENGFPKIDFAPEENVYVLGSGFSSNSNITIDVTRPTIPTPTVDTGYSQTNENGEFVYEYDLDGIEGDYFINAYNGLDFATANFTDNPGAIWTTKNDCGDVTQDVNHYNVGDRVYINGEGFPALTHSWSIKGQPGSCDPSTVVASGFIYGSSFCFNAYNITSGDCGVYKATVSNKDDNYQIDAWCEKYTSSTQCSGNGCQWCNQCQWPTSPTKTNQWGTGRCVVPGTDCGWHCATGYCNATCGSDSDCSCPASGCQGNDYYDYPAYGTCKDCTKACYCNVSTSQGQPCAPTVTLSDPRCLPPQDHAECQSGTCVVVQGPGSNQCSINSDCYHSECDYIGRTCKQVNAWPDVQDQCDSFNNCIHSECVGESCTVIDSPGTSTCTNNSQCLTPKHSECSNGQCIQVNGTGSNQCSIASDCYHSECDFNLQQCKAVNAWPDVIDSCTSNDQCTACVPDITVSKKVSPNSFSICQNTTVTLNVTGIGCAQITHFPLDTVLIIDRSGSMADYNKLVDAKAAAKTFVDLTDSSTDRNALVSFGTTSSLDQVLTFDKTLVKNAIDSLTTDDWTAIGSAINTANTHLSSTGRVNAIWIEILLSDGGENQGTDPIGKANNAKALGITIYTIGLGGAGDFNETLLKEIANITGGKYYFAPNGTVLQGIYQNISKEVLNMAGKNAVVKDVIPSYANYADALSSNPADNCTYSAGTRTVTCNLGNIVIGQSYLITFNEQLNTSGNNILTNVYPASNVTFTDFNNTQQTRIFPQTFVNVTACDDGVFCNGVETCSQGSCQQGTPLNCSTLSDQCKVGECNEAFKNCTVSFKPLSTPCNDGLWCSATDHCDGLGNCVQLTPRDCSGFNLSKVETCDNNPDSYHFTWDFRNSFTSICNETNDSCTSGNNTITHTCSVANCTAECDATHSCDNKCIGNVRYSAGNCSLTTCNCSYTTQNCDLQDGCYVYQTGCEDRDYFCQVAGCNYTFSNRNNDSYDSYINYCSADTIRTHRTFHDFSCDNGCKDHTSFVNDSLVQDCSLQNGWVNTTNYQWINVTQCIQKEQVQQEYHKFTCGPAVNCTYTVNQTRWIDTGNVNSSDVTGPTTSNLTTQIKCNIMNITATEVDTCSNISEAEYFFDTCPDKNTRGTPLLASDGTFDEKIEDVYQTLIDLKFLSDGRHTLYVRGKDDKGNWGQCASRGFDVDILPPYTSEQSITPSMACGNNPTVTALVCETPFFNQTNICGAEYFIDDFSLGNGEGFPMQPVDGTWDEFCEWVTGTINTSLLTEGTHHVQVHAMDCSCNWGKMTQTPVWFIKDTKYPITTKQLIPYQDKFVQCYGNEQQDSNVADKAPNGLTDGCGYVKGGTQIVLSAQDQDTPDHEYSDNVSIHWKVWYKVNAGDSWIVDQEGVGVIGQNVTITLNKDSYHLIEYWTVDSCGNEEPHHFELDIVDTKPPIITKTVGDPKVSCDPADPSGCVYFVKDHVTQINLNCTDQQPHPVNSVNLWFRILLDGEVLQDWTDRIAVQSFKQIIFDEDSVHTLQYYCEDALGNSDGTRDNPHQQVYKVDSTAPNTTKTYGSPKYPDSLHPQWINSSTLITLTAVDGGDICHVGVNKTYWRNTVLTSNDACENPSVCQEAQGLGSWNEYVAPFNKPEESCHLIEYYSIDLLGNTEAVKKQCVYVENTPPVSSKTVGDPKKQVDCSTLEQGTFTDNCYYVNQNTPITLSCSETGPHPTGVANIYYKIDWKNNAEDEWTLGQWIQDSNQITFNYPEDSYHRLTWYCVDVLGNKEQDHTELDLVDTTPPISQKTMGDPKHACTQNDQTTYYPGMPAPTDGCYFINQSTPIDLTCSDQQPHPVDNVKIYYRDYLFDTTPPSFTEVNDDHITITKNEDSRHILEWYCTDELGNKENNHVEYDIVDTQYPTTTKEIIGPQYWFEEKHFIDGVSRINLTCSDGDTHPVDHVNVYYRYRVNDGSWTGWTQYTTPFGFPEESKHEIEYYCADALGNEEQHHFEIDYVDKTPPVTTKEYGTPYYTDEGSEWINSSTSITLTATDGESVHASGVDDTYWRVTLVDDRYCSGEWDCQEAQGSGSWNVYEREFFIQDQSCHLIEFYSVDNVNKTEIVNKQCPYVENTPPISSKTVGEPKHECTEDEWYQYGQPQDGCWYINQSTKIDLTCSDGEPHPVDNVNIYYRDYLLGQTVPDFTLVQGGYVEINKNEDSAHVLEWYCTDALGNEEQHHYEIDIVDSQYPNVTKTVGEPKVSCGDNCWYITNETEITLDCTDGEPHPVDHVSTYYRYYLDGVLTQDWTLYTDPFKLPEYSNHTVQYYCKDILGNTGPIFTEEDKVDNVPPVIIPDPCYDIKPEDKVTIWATITDDKVGIDDSTTKAYVKCPDRDVEELLLVYNSTTGRYEAQWTSPDLEGVCYVDFAASDLLGSSTYLEDGKFIVIDNTPPTISSVFTGRTWIGLGDKFYVDAEVDDNSVHFEEVCKPLKCFVRIVDNAGKEGYLEGELEFVNDVLKCAGFVTVNDTFYEAQAQLWVDAIDGAGYMASERKLEPIGIDNARMISITGVNESQWFKGGQWINNVVATVDSSKFGEVTSCSASISGVSPENTLVPVDNTCVGNIRIPYDISDGEKNLTVYATNINGKIISDTINVRIDNTAPNKQILSPTNGTYVSTEIPVILNVTDELSGVYNASFRVVKDPLTIFGLITIPGTGYDSGWISTAFNGTTWNYTFNASDLVPGETYYFLSMVCDNVGNCQDPLSYTILIVDRTPPAWPSSATLSVTSSPYDKDGTVILGWPEAYDKNGVNHYDININGIMKSATAGTAYTFLNLSDGFYSFSVIPVDTSGNRGTGLTGSTTVKRSCTADVTCTSSSTSSSGGGSGSGGGSSTGTSYTGTSKTGTTQESGTVDTTQITECIPYWSCGSWSACENGKQTRECNDKNECVKTAKTETQDCNAETAATNSLSPLTGLFTAVNSPVGYAVVASSLIFLIIIILKSKILVAGKRKRR